MKILSLHSENVKRLKVVEIKPDGALVVIGGNNAEGKTSTLDSVMYALGGKKVLGKKPVRDGAARAVARLELDGDFVIERTITREGESKLEVRSKAGAKFNRPQELLDSLCARFSFDPLAFLDIDGRQQAELLRKLSGVDTSALDSERANLYAKRTNANSEAKRLEAVLAGMAYDADAGTDPVQVDALADELTRLEKARMNFQAARERFAHLALELARARAKVAELEAEELTVKAWLESPDNAPPEADAVRAQLADAQRKNAAVDANRRYIETKRALNRANSRVTQMTERIDAIDAEKAAVLAAANLPVPGLSFSDEGVLLNGVPLEEASGAEKIRVSVGIGFALNPKLRVLLVRDGSRLDKKNLQLLAELAAERDGQVWIERVGDGPECTVVIEDGTVIEDRTESARAAA